MSWSLHLRNGDLVLNSSSLGTVTGHQKLVQDLRNHILEKMGTDDMHPTFGSLLNGGRLPDGTNVFGVIGQANDDLTRMEVESELRRIIGEYQAQQLERARDDRLAYGKVTLSREEVLIGVRNMKFQRINDALNITITLETGDNRDVNLLLQLPT